jgi:molybdopterin-dependent oxidoreductase alpha subunit
LPREPVPGSAEGDDARLRITAPATHAAGLQAALSSLVHVGRHVGVVRGARTLSHLNQPDGFDCPGCAWPEPANASHAEFCENGAKAIAEEATRRRIDAAFFAEHSVDDLQGRTDFWLGQQGRLTQPMWLPPGGRHYEPISWDHALDRIAGALNATAPDRAVFYTSGRTSNEAAFAYQLFVRAHGTNNLPDCSNMCHESSGVALTATIGIGKGTVTLDDVHAADVIVVMGQNPGTNHPRMLSALEQAKHRGARIVALNPLPEAGLLRFKNPQRASGLLGSGTGLADLHLPIRVGADLALLQYVNRRLVAEGRVDDDFLAARCDGVDEMKAHLRSLDEEWLIEQTALARPDVDRFVDWVAGTNKIIVCWAMGITQHRGAVPTIQERPHDGHLREAGPRLPRPARGGDGDRPAP